MAKILFVMTGADHWTLADGTRHPTGFWAEEAAVPYQDFTRAGHDVVVATPGGVVPTLDRASLAPEANGGQEGADRIAAVLEEMTPLKQPFVLSEIDPAEYDVVFYPGGHGPMEDLAVDKDSARLLTGVLASGKPLGIVCHAPAALLATEDAEGDSPFSGYSLTGFTNAEEYRAGLADKAKWLLQDRLVAMGAEFQEGEPWAPKVVVDRNLYTGQNPASAGPLAERILRSLG
ncbi:type 1 glutamine amidotransferase domain-containing protein [Streptomyces tsukubensis]|uniref:Type 1 glutamine amidotransferase domain-containing protein n=1 Tax=Streptomyces tsukubensis TaxID=83656 RepID=A0A1V4A068_9ACTN|nr:type 1 glutamine amidotransferase domain-containing protein [Streptomyces tsukubensis]OON72186.1 type 1 glutamine amidotransferase domain-containing protein [Streptomyces tsukubensis]QFR97079.1 type 1 glutamine amidotransferase domain-containing protein [Streptomyces tsukubensis]